MTYLSYLNQPVTNKLVKAGPLVTSVVLHAGIVSLLLFSSNQTEKMPEFLSVDLIGGAVEKISNLPQSLPKTIPSKKKSVPQAAAEQLDNSMSAAPDEAASNSVDSEYSLEQFIGNVAYSNDPRTIYFTKIFQQISRVKSYPSAAKQLSLEGSVRLKLQIDKLGEILSIEAVEFDHEILKNAAIDSIRKVGKFDPPPFNIKGDSFSLLIPLRYQLK